MWNGLNWLGIGSPEGLFLMKFPMVSGSLFTTTWHILRLRMERKASRYGAYIEYAVEDS
jgi:hypothetical protein